MTDGEILSRVIAIKGIGRWTVEVLLIFNPGRPDVPPVHDLGVRREFHISQGKRKCPSLIAWRGMAHSGHRSGRRRRFTCGRRRISSVNAGSDDDKKALITILGSKSRYVKEKAKTFTHPRNV